jgi:hypothetical protein
MLTFSGLVAGDNHVPDARFHDLSHCDPAQRGLDAQLLHQCIVNVECSLHMANHIADMGIWKQRFDDTRLQLSCRRCT